MAKTAFATGRYVEGGVAEPFPARTTVYVGPPQATLVETDVLD